MAQLREWTRRDFLRAAGIGAAGAALLPFLPTTAAQAAGSAIKRLVLFTHPNGNLIHRWRSNGSGAPFVSGAPIPQLMGPVLAPLERHRAHVSLVDGLDFDSGMLPRPGSSQPKGAGHFGIACVWSGARLVYAPLNTSEPSYHSNAATIDQIIGAQQATRVRSLVIGTSRAGKETDHPLEGISSYAGAAQPIPPEENPTVVFDLLFAGPVDGSALSTQRRRAARQSILSNVKGELSRLRTELPALDRERLDRHLAGVDDLDRRLAATVSPSCVPPQRPGALPSSGGQAAAAQDELNHLRMQFDIVKHAFACDLTRVANVMLGAEGSAAFWVPVSQLPIDPRNGDMHMISHETYFATDETWRRQAVEILSLLCRGAAEEFAGLLDRLDEGPGPTLLDETLAVSSTAMGWGGPHTNWSVPFVLASKHPRFVGGRYHRFGNYDLDIETSVPTNPWAGPTVTTPHNRLLTTVMQLMGRADVQAVGDAGTGGQLGGQDLDNTPISALMA